MFAIFAVLFVVVFGGLVRVLMVLVPIVLAVGRRKKDEGERQFSREGAKIYFPEGAKTPVRAILYHGSAQKISQVLRELFLLGATGSSARCKQKRVLAR